jgi:hypothetical protein
MGPSSYGFTETVQAQLAEALYRATVAETIIAEKDAHLIDQSATIRAKDDALDALRFTIQAFRDNARSRPRIIDAGASPAPRAPRPPGPRVPATQRLWTWLMGT